MRYRLKMMTNLYGYLLTILTTLTLVHLRETIDLCVVPCHLRLKLGESDLYVLLVP